jgi:hypothetical protein
MAVGRTNLAHGFLKGEREYLHATMTRTFLLNDDDRRAIGVAPPLRERNIDR